METELKDEIEEDVTEDIKAELDNQRENYSDFKEWKANNYYQLKADFCEENDIKNDEYVEEYMDKNAFNEFCKEWYNEITIKHDGG